jgi:hypothetical protein
MSTPHIPGRQHEARWVHYHEPWPSLRQIIGTIVGSLVAFAAIMAIAVAVFS